MFPFWLLGSLGWRRLAQVCRKVAVTKKEEREGRNPPRARL